MSEMKLFEIPVKILLNDEEIALFEEYQQKAATKGLDLSFEKFLASLLEVGSTPHLKRQAAFYIDGKII